MNRVIVEEKIRLRSQIYLILRYRAFSFMFVIRANTDIFFYLL